MARRAGLLALLMLLGLLWSCETDPGAGLASQKTEYQKLVDWMELWDDEADKWSVAYVGVTKELRALDGRVPVERAHAWGSDLRQAVSNLRMALDKAGPPQSAAAPTYADALEWTIDRVRPAARATAICEAAACGKALPDLLRTSRALWQLVLKTAAVNVVPSGATRTEFPESGLRNASGGDGTDRQLRIPPGDFLCRPELETRDVLADLGGSATSVGRDWLSGSGTVVQVQVKKWPTWSAAYAYFDVLDVRAITCALELPGVTGQQARWESGEAPKLSVRTVAWRRMDPEIGLQFLGMSALVDDTVVTVVVAGQRPSEELAQSLLRRGIEGLGVKP